MLDIEDYIEEFIGRRIDFYELIDEVVEEYSDMTSTKEVVEMVENALKKIIEKIDFNYKNF